MIHKRRYAISFLLLAVLLLAGCKQAIYTQLTEHEANEVLLTLIKGGVQAEKRRVDEKNFSVWVSESEIATAVELLRASAQPSEHYSNLGDIFSRNGLISSPTEERVRFIYGLQQELARTLSQIDGVLVARVHIVLPSNDPFAKDVKPASASVFLKHRADMNMQVVVPAVKDLVVRSIEGVAADGVAVTLFPARSTLSAPEQAPVSHFLGALVSPSSVMRLWIMVTLPWLVVAALVFLLSREQRVGKLLEAVLNKARRARAVNP